jgi:hypothetical protein
MFASHPRREVRLHTAARRAAARLGRLAVALAAISCAGLISAASASAAPVMIPIPPGGPAVPPAAVRVVAVGGGMAGWQIALIAFGAALVAAIAAVAMDRARAARKAASGTALTRPVWP